MVSHSERQHVDTQTDALQLGIAPERLPMLIADGAESAFKDLEGLKRIRDCVMQHLLPRFFQSGQRTVVRRPC